MESSEEIEAETGNRSRDLDAATLSSSAFGVHCWQKHKGMQLNWPAVRGWNFVSRVFSTTKKKKTEQQKQACMDAQRD